MNRLQDEPAAMMTCVGSTSGVLPFLSTVVGGLLRRGPSLTAHLATEGLIYEDLQEIEETLLGLVGSWDKGQEEDVLVHWRRSRGSTHGNRTRDEDDDEHEDEGLL